jgi:hypothetical protein
MAGWTVNRQAAPVVAALFFFCILSGPAGIAATGRDRVERSQARAPEWISKVPETDREYLYFVGRATGERSLDAAEQDAAADAIRQIVTLLGVDASFSYDRLRREAELILSDRVTVSGSSVVQGMKRMNTYFEKHTFSLNDTLQTAYDAHLLVRYPVSSLEAEKKKMELESLDRVTQAGEALELGRKLESGGKAGQALLRYREALELTEGTIVFSSAEIAGRRRDLRREALSAAGRLGLGLRLVAVFPVEMGGGVGGSARSDSLMTDALASALQQEGFLTEYGSGAAETAYLPRVSASCREVRTQALEAGFWMSLWTASIRLADPRDEEVFYTGVLNAKGFGPDPERAGLDARRKLRAEVFGRFASSARERLDLVLGRQAGRSTANTEEPSVRPRK